MDVIGELTLFSLIISYRIILINEKLSYRPNTWNQRIGNEVEKLISN